MKKLLFIPSLIGLLLLNSCQQEQPTDTGVSPLQWEQAGHADVEVAYLTFEAAAPTGIEAANPPMFIAGIALIAGAASAWELFSLHRQASNPATDGVTVLPKKYVLANNPYETIGIAHNKALDVLIQLGRPATVADLQKDDFMQKLLAATGDYSVSEQQQLLTDIKNQQLNGGPLSYDSAISMGQYVIGVQADINRLNITNSYHKSYLSNLFAEVDRMDKSNGFKDRLYQKLNLAIENLQTEERVDNKGLIMALTVYKHSYEYWH